VTTAATGSPRLWLDRPDRGSPPSALAIALAVAGALHLALLLGIGFEMPDPTDRPSTTRPLEVMVLRQASPTQQKPETADAFAQVDREGGGLEEVPQEEVEPTPEVIVPPAPEAAEPAAPPPPPIPQPLQAQEPPPAEPAEETTQTAVPTPEPTIEEPPEPQPPPEPPPEPEVIPEPPPPAVSAAEIMASRNLEIAELAARIQQRSSAYSKRERRKAISASTREYKYASYLEAWRRKVERIGNLNYPQEAKRDKLYGTLILHVALRADGSVERIRVLRSSGFEVLDQAAVRIVELAAPFAPFPPDIKAETDILDITRTWQFLRSNRLGWDN
jgi:protein TonB